MSTVLQFCKRTLKLQIGGRDLLVILNLETRCKGGVKKLTRKNLEILFSHPSGMLNCKTKKWCLRSQYENDSLQPIVSAD